LHSMHISTTFNAVLIYQ